MRVKLYQSEAYLRRQYKVLGKTPAQIASQCGCTEMTIWNYLNKFGLVR